MPRNNKFSSHGPVWRAARDKLCPSFPGSGSYQRSKQLAALLGLPYESPGSYVEYPAEVFTLLMQLAGPHGHTILKAYRIQKGLE